jgi:putative hydrolase
MIADRLRRLADLLGLQRANPYKVGAWRRAADSVEACPRDLGEILSQEGPGGLIAIPHVGPGIGDAIRELLQTGRLARLDRLTGALDPERLLRTVPAIGPELAHRIHDRLEIETLEALEVAAHDGRLASLPGIGKRRLEGIRAALQAMLGRMHRRPAPNTPRPDVSEVLEIDREYREAAAAGVLPTIAPRRFNPEHRSWLPVLHRRLGSWHFTALFSNTALAHQLGRTEDWVVVFASDDQHVESQWTVVTENRGSLAGQRVVRGREAECLEALTGPRSGVPETSPSNRGALPGAAEAEASPGSPDPRPG